MIYWILPGLFLLAAAFCALVLRRRGMDLWIGSYILKSPHRLPPPGKPIDVLICIADHFEPGSENASADVGLDRVKVWRQEYPEKFAEFRDSDGRTPRNTFFFPIEEYNEEQVELLAELCREGYGEIEIHLHHDHDTSENLRARLLEACEIFSRRHRQLARDRETGRLSYAFIHGNWALDNSRPDGKWCGVNNEIDILRETGCYVDMTFPSAPNRTQPRKINSIYYAIDDPERPRSHDHGMDVGRGPAPARGLMLIQGPLIVDWRVRRRGVIPRIENGCLQTNQFAHIRRLDSWLKARVQVPSRPDWYFVKLHAHGALPYGRNALLGETMVQFHRDLAERARQDPNFRYHYVTAREMYNLAKAAEAGWQGTVQDALDYRLVWVGQESLDPATV